MKAAHLSPDTWAFIQLLDRYGVEYVIVDGEAVIHYGYVRLTGDVDFFYDNNAENVARLFAALVDFWDGDVPGFDRAEELRPRGQVVTEAPHRASRPRCLTPEPSALVSHEHNF